MIRVNEPTQVTGIWHDALVHSLLFEWSDNGNLAIRLRCEINPEENRSELIDMGITTEIVDAVFREVMQVNTRVPEVTANQPVVLEWDNIEYPAKDSTSKVLPARFVGLLHHKIGCSDGSNIDLLFRQLWLEEVDQ